MPETNFLIGKYKQNEIPKNLQESEGVPVNANRRKDPYYEDKVMECWEMLESKGISQGRRIMYLEEAMTTDDFPQIFGDVIDRKMLMAYQVWNMPFRNYIKIGSVRDFRTVKRFTADGGDGVLQKVNEQEEYPESDIQDTEYSYSVAKNGRKLSFSWESMINDDLDALSDVPRRFANAAARSEQKFATELYCDADGPIDAIYAAGNNNIIKDVGGGTADPALDIDALQGAIETISKQTDPTTGEPILIDQFHLVVPPALEIAANNILQSTEIRSTGSRTGTGNQETIYSANWVRQRIKLHVDPYIPIVANNSNGHTSWFMFADPSNNRPAYEMGFLRGHESPEMFIKTPNARRPGGGDVNFMAGDFDTDAVQYKVRHIYGGTVLDPIMTAASDGSGG